MAEEATASTSKEQLCLAHAAKKGMVDYMKANLDDGAACLTSTDKLGEPAFHLAARYGHAEIIELLLNKGAKPEECLNCSSYNVLHTAALHGHSQVVAQLLKSGVDVNSKGGKTMRTTALGLATDQGRTIAVAALRDQADMPNTRSRKKEWTADADSDTMPRTITPLPLSPDHAQIVANLLENGAEPEAGVETAQLLLSLLESDIDHTNAVGKLLNHVPGPTDKLWKGALNLSLILAASKGHTGAVLHLLRKNADPNEDAGPLHDLWVAAMEDTTHTKMLTDLLYCSEFPSDLNTAIHTGQRALHVAARLGHADVVAALLECSDVDTSKVDKKNRTARHLARAQGHTDIAVQIKTNAAMLVATPSGDEFAKRKMSDYPALANWLDSLLYKGGAPLDCLDCTMEEVKGVNEVLGTKEIQFRYRMLTKLVPTPSEDDRPQCSRLLMQMLEAPGWLSAVHAVRDFFCPTPYVKVKLLYAPHVPVRNVADIRVMKAVAFSQDVGQLKTYFVAACVDQGWQVVRGWVYFDILLNASMVVSTCFVAQYVREGRASMVRKPYIWMACVMGKQALEKGLQCIHTTTVKVRSLGDNPSWYKMGLKVVKAITQYSLHPDTMIDLTFVGYSMFALFILFHDEFEQEEIPHEFRFALAVWYAMMWIRLLFSLRLLKDVGPHFLPVFGAIMIASRFLIVVVFCWGAGVHAYYALELRSFPSPLFAALLQMFRLGFLGDFDLGEFEGVDVPYRKDDRGDWWPVDLDPTGTYVLAHGLFFLVAVCITIVLMNLFIGVLGSAYDAAQDVSPQMFLQARARASANYQILPWVSFCTWWFAEPDDEPRTLYALVRDDEDDSEAAKSIRSSIKSESKKLGTAMDEKFEKLFEQSEQQKKGREADARRRRLSEQQEEREMHDKLESKLDDKPESKLDDIGRVMSTDAQVESRPATPRSC